MGYNGIIQYSPPKKEKAEKNRINLEKKHVKDNIMYRRAYEIAGLQISNEIFTKNEFTKIKRAQPCITLDEAILVFEKARSGITLEKFAAEKQRTAEGYRKAFSKYFYG